MATLPSGPAGPLVAMLVDIELRRVNVGVHGAGDTRHVGTLGQVVAVHPGIPCRPHQHIVCHCQSDAV